MSEVTIENLILKIEQYNPEAKEKVMKAYELAKNLHEGQYRKSGEPYIIHPLNVAYILADMHADCDTLCAGLLHDTLEDTEITKDEIIELFNKDIANLVDGVTKLAKMNYSAEEKEQLKLANTRKIITGITEDVRIIIIKLADRLHNMRTLQFKSVLKQKENALETMEIFVPLAYYIGAYRIKSELEDLSLKYLKSDTYKQIEEEKIKIEEESKEYLRGMLYKINNQLSDRNIPNEIKIRIKNIYGIYKSKCKGIETPHIHDLLALKIMVDEIENCYRALYIVHQNYHPINSKFKDYICNPKTNMYQSLHSTVFGLEERIVQTQIRTFEMDKIADYGLSAHWDIYKGNARYAMQEHLKSKSQFFNSLSELNYVFDNNKDFVEQAKIELFGNNVYAYTKDGDTIELPKGATIIDFAYKIHTDIGNSIISATVNNEEVPIDYVIHNKDRIIVKTDENSRGPQADWEEKTITTKARRKIREFTRKSIN